MKNILDNRISRILKTGDYIEYNKGWMIITTAGKMLLDISDNYIICSFLNKELAKKKNLCCSTGTKKFFIPKLKSDIEDLLSDLFSYLDEIWIKDINHELRNLQNI